MSATVNVTESGRLITIVNRSGNTVSVGSVDVAPNRSASFSLSSFLKEPAMAAALAVVAAINGVTVQIGDDRITAVGAGVVDAPMSGDLWLVKQEWTNVAALVDNAIKTSWTCAATAQTYATTALNGTVGAGPLDYARNIIVTGVTAGGEALLQKTLLITGLDIDGKSQSESLVVSTGNQGAGSTVVYTGINAFKQITSIYVPADASVSPGAYKVGFSNKLGLSRPITSGGVLREFLDNALRTTAQAGTLVLAASSPPYGTWTPDTTPNGSRDYVIYYVAN